MEIEGHIGLIHVHEETPEIRYIGVNYGPLLLRYIVLWTVVTSNQYPAAEHAYNWEYRVGLRYDKETLELLGIWKKY